MLMSLTRFQSLQWLHTHTASWQPTPSPALHIFFWGRFLITVLRLELIVFYLACVVAIVTGGRPLTACELVNMPPKDGKSAKNKGGNISKAERERLQREADEQRRREEEETRVIAEREENERLERERIEQEKQEQLELKDRERREDELNELRHILDENHSAVTAWESECMDKAKWERYMRCDGSPDPSVQPEINTFISLWRDDSETQIQQVLENCVLALQLTNELDFLLSEGPDPSVALQYRETLLCLQSIIHCKLNQATEELLKSASSLSDIETGNMQTVVQDENITLCLWANLNKNPRFKGFRFEEVGLGFELPKPLAVIDVAVRILHTRYDHMSHHSEREQLQRRRSMMEAVLTPPIESIAAVQDEKMEGEVDERESSKPVEEDSRSVGSDSRKRGKQCMLHMEETKNIDHLLGKWMSPSDLQKAMRRAGINIFVNEYSDKYVSINPKDPLIEHTVYEQMALISSAVAFSWSRWNTQCGQEHLVLQACEQLEAGPVAEEAWSLYLLGAQRNQHLKMKEHDDSFSPELAEGSEFHSTFLHMLRQDMSTEGQARVRQSHYLYTDTVEMLLCATRVLTYS